MFAEDGIHCHGLTRAVGSEHGCELFEVASEDSDGDPIGGERRLRAFRAAQSFFGQRRALLWIHPDQAKARKAIPVPLNAEAVALIGKQVGKHQTYVFCFRGQAITQVSTKAWYAALERAGIVDFRWHDLRHTWASWHVQNGTPLYALQELGGWASTEMVRRYAHLAADHLAPYAQRLGEVRARAAQAHGTDLSQAGN